MNGGTIQLQIGGSLELVLRPPPPQVTVVVTASYRGFSVTAQGERMAYTLPSRMSVEMQVAYVDQAGNAAVVDGDVAWASSNDALVSVDVGSDTTQCLISAVGPVGTAQVTATADADLGSGVRSLVTLLDVTVVAGEAVAGTISPVGEPEPMS